MTARPIRIRRTTRTNAGRRAAELRRVLGRDVFRLRSDAGVSQRRLAAEAGVSQGLLSMIEAGHVDVSMSVMSAIADVLGADFSARLYPNTGPRIHDRIQARMVEAFLAELHPRWTPSLEVAVRSPARGWIDLVLVDIDGRMVVGVESESTLKRVEQQLRWHEEKVSSLPSSDLWRQLERRLSGTETLPQTSRLLLLRASRTNREVVAALPTTLAASHGARMADLLAAVRTPNEPWPGAGVLWLSLEGSGARLLDHPPRDVALGR